MLCDEQFEEYEKLYEDVVTEFHNRFLDDKGEIIFDTQTPIMIPLQFNLIPQQYIVKNVNKLIRIIEKLDNHLVTGFLGTAHSLNALADNGEVAKAYELLLREEYPSWLYEVKKGATTIWGHWDGIKENGEMWDPDMNSFNHYSYGTGGSFLYCQIGGGGKYFFK